MLYKPMKLPFKHIPSIATGVETKGNRTTTEGRQFFSVVTTMLQESFKLRAQATGDEPETDFDTFMAGAAIVTGLSFPGLDYEPKANEFQHIEYLGTKKKKITWRELESVDYDFDGTPDADSYDAAFPLDLYSTTGAFSDLASSGAVDYSSFWLDNKGTLSGAASLWQMIASGDYLRLETFEEKMTLLLGFLEMKRRWVYGLTKLGVNIFEGVIDLGTVAKSTIPAAEFRAVEHLFADPDSNILVFRPNITEEDIASCFVSAETKLMLQQAHLKALEKAAWTDSGRLNVSFFWNYILESNDVLERMGLIFGLEPEVELDEAGAEIAAPEEESAAAAAARDFFEWAEAVVMPQLRDHLESVRVARRDSVVSDFLDDSATLSAVLEEVNRIDVARGFASLGLLEAKHELDGLSTELAELIDAYHSCEDRLARAAGDAIEAARTALANADRPVNAKQREIVAQLEVVITLQGDDGAAMADAFWHEFSMADEALGFNQPVALNIKDGSVAKSGIPAAEFLAVEHLFVNPAQNILVFRPNITKENIASCSVSEETTLMLQQALDMNLAKKTMTAYSNETMKYVIGLIRQNTSTKRRNNIIDKKISQQKDDEYYEKLAELRAEAKELSARRSEDKRGGAKLEQAAQARRKAAARGLQKPKKKEPRRVNKNGNK